MLSQVSFYLREAEMLRLKIEIAGTRKTMSNSSISLGRAPPLWEQMT